MERNKEKNITNNNTRELLSQDETNIFKAYCNIYHKAKFNWYRNLNDSIFNEDHDSTTIRGMILAYKSYLNGSLKEMSKLETPLTTQQIVNICFILMFLMGPFIRLVNSKVLGYYLSDFDIASMTSVFRTITLVFITLLLRKFISLLLNIIFSSIMLSILNIVKFFQKLLRRTRHKTENGTKDVIMGDLKDNFKWNTALKFGFIFINNILYLCIGGILIALSGTIEAAIVTLGLGIAKVLDITVGIPQRLISRILAVNGKIPTKLINISRSKIRDKTLLKSEVQGLNAAKTKNKEKKRFFDKITKSFERIVGRIGKILDNIKNVSTPRRLRNNGYFGKGDANSIRRLRGNSNSSRQQGRKEPKFSREEKTNDNNTKQQTREKNNTEIDKTTTKVIPNNPNMNQTFPKPSNSVDSSTKTVLNQKTSTELSNKSVHDNPSKTKTSPSGKNEPIIPGTNFHVPDLKTNLLNNNNNSNKQDTFNNNDNSIIKNNDAPNNKTNEEIIPENKDIPNDDKKNKSAESIATEDGNNEKKEIKKEENVDNKKDDINDVKLSEEQKIAYNEGTKSTEHKEALAAAEDKKAKLAAKKAALAAKKKQSENQKEQNNLEKTSDDSSKINVTKTEVNEPGHQNSAIEREKNRDKQRTTNVQTGHIYKV